MSKLIFFSLQSCKLRGLSCLSIPLLSFFKLFLNVLNWKEKKKKKPAKPKHHQQKQ